MPACNCNIINHPVHGRTLVIQYPFADKILPCLKENKNVDAIGFRVAEYGTLYHLPLTDDLVLATMLGKHDLITARILLHDHLLMALTFNEYTRGLCFTPNNKEEARQYFCKEKDGKLCCGISTIEDVADYLVEVNRRARKTNDPLLYYFAYNYVRREAKKKISRYILGIVDKGIEAIGNTMKLLRYSFNYEIYEKIDRTEYMTRLVYFDLFVRGLKDDVIMMSCSASIGPVIVFIREELPRLEKWLLELAGDAMIDNRGRLKVIKDGLVDKAVNELKELVRIEELATMKI